MDKETLDELVMKEDEELPDKQNSLDDNNPAQCVQVFQRFDITTNEPDLNLDSCDNSWQLYDLFSDISDIQVAY